jgi:predicted secreted protein
MRLLTFAILNLQFAIAVCARAQTNSSLTDSTDDRPPATDQSPADDDVQAQLAQLRETVKTLTQSLAESNAEAEVFRRRFSDLQLRMEALGLPSASKDRAKLEQRLLTAVSDLQLAQKERDEFRDQMLRLSEATLRYLKPAEGGDAQARMDVEAQVRAMNSLLARSSNPPASQPSLLDGSVISVKQEWSFVVGNFGAREGVKMGMPLRVKRGDNVIARLRVIDVRDRICGAVIQESGKEKIKVGDRLEVDARRDVSER